MEGAYVLEIHKCPPCPAGAQCKPCLGDYIVITDNLDEEDPLLIKRLKVFIKDLDHYQKFNIFELKKKCAFIAKVRGNVPSGKPIEDLDLIDLLHAR